MGFNALPRAILISTADDYFYALDVRDVSMPFRGLFSFLRPRKRGIDMMNLVSMPFRGLFSFLLL